MFIPFYNCIKCKKKRCKTCNNPINNDSGSFCDKTCEIVHVYQDSFRSLDNDQHKYLTCIDL